MPDIYRKALHGAILVSTPIVFLFSALNGGLGTLLAVFFCAVLALSAGLSVLDWENTIENVGREILPFAPPLIVRLTSGMLTLAACLLHEAPLAPLMFCAVLADLCVTEIFYIKSEEMNRE